MCATCYERDSCTDDYPLNFIKVFEDGVWTLKNEQIPWVNKRNIHVVVRDALVEATDQNVADPIWCGKIDLVNKKAEGDWGWVVGPDTGFISTIRDEMNLNYGWSVESEFKYLENHYHFDI